MQNLADLTDSEINILPEVCVYSNPCLSSTNTHLVMSEWWMNHEDQRVIFHHNNFLS